MPLAVIFIVIGLYLLSRAADEFVTGAVRVSAALQVSVVVIGAVIVGFGTSAPEMFVSGLASAQGDDELAIGNIVGSNTANLTLVLGFAALITPIAVHWTVLRREAPLAFGSTVAFALAVQDGLTTAEGVILGVFLVASLTFIVVSARREVGASREVGALIVEEIDDLMGEEPPELRRELVRTLLGLAGTVAGAALLVEGARTVAEEVGLSEGFVGLTLVAIGTSLPELVTSAVAARQGHTDLIVGNLLGSNMFNSLAVGAITGIAGDGMLDDPDLAGLPIWVMLGVALVTWVLMMAARVVTRSAGIALLIAYLASLPAMPREG